VDSGCELEAALQARSRVIDGSGHSHGSRPVMTILCLFTPDGSIGEAVI
jgi:hypothetical protein